MTGRRPSVRPRARRARQWVAGRPAVPRAPRLCAPARAARRPGDGRHRGTSSCRRRRRSRVARRRQDDSGSPPGRRRTGVDRGAVAVIALVAAIAGVPMLATSRGVVALVLLAPAPVLASPQLGARPRWSLLVANRVAGRSCRLRLKAPSPSIRRQGAPTSVRGRPADRDRGQGAPRGLTSATRRPPLRSPR